MDIYGIGAGIEAAVKISFLSCRQTGRTTRMIEALRPGDRVICHGSGEQRHTRAMLNRVGKDGVEVILLPVNQSHRLKSDMRSRGGKDYFTHDWLEAFWLYEIQEVQQHVRGITLSANNDLTK